MAAETQHQARLCAARRPGRGRVWALGLLVWGMWACAEPAPTAAPAAADVQQDVAVAQFDAAVKKDSASNADSQGAKADAVPDSPKSDSGNADGGAADATVADAAADDGAVDAGQSGCAGGCDDNNPCTTDSCQDGACLHVGNGSCCILDSDCDDGNLCTADTCSAAGCAHLAKSCDDGLGCTNDGCDKTNGNCKHKAKAGTCAIDGACWATGESAPGQACQVCTPDLSQTVWSEQVDVSCDDGNPCTGKDICTVGGKCVGVPKVGCCKQDGDCGSATCSKSTCSAATGECATEAIVGCCESGSCCDAATHTAAKAGTSCDGAVLSTEWACADKVAQYRTATAGCTGTGPTACSSDPKDWAWSGWVVAQTCGAAQKCVTNAGAAAQCVDISPSGCTTAADCDDGNKCTDDLCSKGACQHPAKACPAGSACEVATCDAATGTCGLAPQPGLCAIGGVCALAGVKKPGDPCYACQPTIDPKAWTLLATCKCASGPCCQSGVVKPVGSTCGATPVATEYACSADGQKVQSRQGFAGCTGPTAQCSAAPELLSWSPYSDVQTCAAGQACQVLDKTQPGTCKSGADPVCSLADAYEAGTSTKMPFDLGVFTDATAKKALAPDMVLGAASDVDVVRWTVTDLVNGQSPDVSVSWSAPGAVKVCTYYACNVGTGKACQPAVCPVGSAPVADPDVSSATANGCCTTAADGTLQWTPTATSGPDHSGKAWLSVSNASPSCQKVSVTLGFGKPLQTACVPGTQCCEVGGTFSPQGKACGTITVASEYQCDSAAPGGKVQVRTAVQGCSGSAATCSAAPADYAWSAWAVQKACLATETCAVADKTLPGTCVPAATCTPGLGCCDATGKAVAAGTPCGKAIAAEYQCSGQNIQFRKQFGSCNGSTTSCSLTATQWTVWATVSSCAANQTCTPGPSNGTMPTCVATPPNLCTVADTWEGAESTDMSKSLGSFADSDAAIWLDPKVRLQSATDKDFFTAALADNTNVEEPVVDVTWSAAKPVTVCAYYRCLYGAGGKDCAPVKCPAGALLFTNTAVSATAGNGCCMTAATGNIHFVPDAPGTDETGNLYFNVKNEDPACQEVSVKVAFGSKTSSVCDPTATCCTAKGTFAAAGTACGGSAQSEYKCAGTAALPVVQQRGVLGGCSGTSTVCDPTKVNYSPWVPYMPCAAPEVCAVTLSSMPGSCMVPPAGSCKGVCGGVGKGGNCFCDAVCAQTGDCCADMGTVCAGSCENSCGLKSVSGPCWCDGYCSISGDCCLDKATKCP